jgi:hypothetical protein
LLLWNWTLANGMGVTLSSANTWPVIEPLIAGNGVSVLTPPVGTTKFWIAASSAGASPANASGGS